MHLLGHPVNAACGRTYDHKRNRNLYCGMYYFIKRRLDTRYAY